MGAIDTTAAVGTLVAEHGGRARVFESLGIDYCCHGQTPLDEACVLRGVDLAEVVAALEASDRQPDGGAADYRAWAPSALAEHIVATHHAFLGRELPRLTALIDRVREVHGASHPELHEVADTFAALRAELTDHLMKEERILFPLIQRLETAHAAFPIHCGTVQNPIRVMEHEHEDAGAALERLRQLTDDYRIPEGVCASFQALYDGLRAFEADMHQHIHKENNVLFPMAARLEAQLHGATI